MNNKRNISAYENLFFIGIGGIGMSALAQYFSRTGKKVAGYDKVPSVITKKLENIGVEIHYKEDVRLISKEFLEKEKTLIVYTPAIPKEHKELNYFLKNEFVILKRAALLGLITKETFCFAVAGTHGKTTTSAILGHVLKETGVNATSFLGGIATNYKSNLILGGNKISVVEADEYDKSFLQLNPNIACITSMDADHLDIYKKATILEETFREFANIVTDKLFVRYGLDLNGITFGFEEKADYQAKNNRVEKGMSVFDVQTPKETISNVKIQLLGAHNVLNALAAIAMANSYEIPLEKIKQSLANFKGIERRFNIKINTENLVLIDDYAHHPTEINAIYKTVKNLYPNKYKMVIFQPHLYSRTRDFIDDFAKSLAQFDAVKILDIYPAREHPIQGVTSKWLAGKIKEHHKNVTCIASTKEAVLNHIKIENTVVAMLGAGDIGEIIKDVCEDMVILAND